MRDRLSIGVAAATARRTALSIDAILLTPHGRQLTVLLVRSSDSRAKERWELPWDSVGAEESIEEVAARLASSSLGAMPVEIEQLAAFGDHRRHPGAAEVSIAFLGFVPAGSPAPVGGESAWFPSGDIPDVAPRHRAMIDSALRAVSSRVDQSPIAFRLLPATFTLSQLQEIYELLIGRHLHKASFRRALHAAWLVEPTDEWRSEGRGRPARLFRYAPRKRRGSRRGVRFEGVGFRE